MMRSVVGVGLVAFFACAGVAAAAPTNILFSGQSFFVDLDANGNGPDSGDCRFQATYDPNNFALTITPVGATTLRLCTGGIMGSAFLGSDTSSDFLDLALASTTAQPSTFMAPNQLGNLGLTLVPGTIELIDEAMSGMPDGLPLAVNEIDFRDGAFQQRAFVNLCSANGPAAQIRFADGTSTVLHLSFFPNALNPTYLVLPNIPTELAAPNHGTFNPVNLYVPVTNDRRLTMVLDIDSEPVVIVDLPLDQLRSCPSGVGSVAAPSLTQWGFTGLLIGLLAIGVWRLTIGRGGTSPS
jgi:hypothetical protein